MLLSLNSFNQFKVLNFREFDIKRQMSSETSFRDETLRKQHDLELEVNRLKEELLRSKTPQVVENRKKDEEFTAK